VEEVSRDVVLSLAFFEDVKDRLRVLDVFAAELVEYADEFV